MNQTTAAMTGNISSIGNAPKRMHADTASPSNAKRQKASDEAMRRLGMNRPTSALLQVTRAQQEQAPPNSLSEVEDPSKSFLGSISQDYDVDEKTYQAVTVKLAEIVNKHFSA